MWRASQASFRRLELGKLGGDPQVSKKLPPPCRGFGPLPEDSNAPPKNLRALRMFWSGIEEKGTSPKIRMAWGRLERPRGAWGAPKKAPPSRRRIRSCAEDSKRSASLEMQARRFRSPVEGSGVRWKIRGNPGIFSASLEASERRSKDRKRVPEFCGSPETSTARSRALQTARRFWCSSESSERGPRLLGGARIFREPLPSSF